MTKQLPKAPISIQRMKNQGALKINLANAPQQSPFPLEKTSRIDTPVYPHFTSDEQKHDHILFPGQSISYEINLTIKECPDVKQVKFWAEGTISRRHLFHHYKEIPIESESIVYQL